MTVKQNKKSFKIQSLKKQKTRVVMNLFSTVIS